MNEEQIFLKLCEIISDLFEINCEIIKIENNSDDIKGWDSLGQLRLFMAIEECFRTKFTFQEISAKYSVGELVFLIKKRLIVTGNISK